MMRWTLPFISFLLLPIADATAQDAPKKMLQWKGYVKDLQGLNVYGAFDSSALVNLIHNRIDLKADFSPSLSARLEVRNRIFSGGIVRKTPGFATGIDQYPGLFDLSRIWIDRPSLVAHSVVDRLLLSWSIPKWEVTLGRQRINWGMNTVWNPNDIFNAYNFLDFDYEERPGNDAIRVRHYPKENSTLEFAWKPGRRSDEHIASMLYRWNRKKYDWQLLGGIYNADLVVGAGWAGSIGESGFKGELSYFHPYRQLADSSGVLSASVMMDHTFSSGWYLSGSVLYNGSPSGALGSGGIYSSNLSAKSLFPFRYSFYLGTLKNLGTLWNLSTAIVFSPEHASLIIFPAISCNAGERLDVDLTVQAFLARIQGAYGMQGGAVYLRGRWSF